MGIISATPPVLAPSMTMIVEGGELCCSDSMQVNDVIEHLLKSGARKIADNVGHKIILPSNGSLACKEPVPMERVAEFVGLVERELKDERRSIIALVTSSKLGRYGAALALGLQKEDFEGKERSLLLVSSKRRFQDDSGSCVRTMEHAFELSNDPQMHGRMGGLLGKDIWPLPGLAVSSNNGAYSRYQPIAELEDDQWMFIRPRPEHRPIGSGKEFGLVGGVRTHSIPEDPDEFTLGNVSPDEKAMVIKTRVPGDPFQALPSKVLQDINAAERPTVLVREYTQAEARPSADVAFYPWMIDGGRLFSGEAKVVLSHALFLAEQQKITNPEDVIAFIRSRFAQYDFR